MKSVSNLVVRVRSGMTSASDGELVARAFRLVKELAILSREGKGLAAEARILLGDVIEAEESRNESTRNDADPAD